MKTIPHPPTVSKDAWLEARLRLLEEEKALTKEYDRVSALRRRLPMVKLEKEYSFEGPAGQTDLRRLFGEGMQLIVYHFMFDPKWEKGCPGCTSFIDALGDLSMLGDRRTAFAVISRAPLPKLQSYRAEKGWTIPWYSSHDSDFNYDFHATLDASKAPIFYNYKTPQDLKAREGDFGAHEGEGHGLSVFFKVDEDLYHTYSCYARGCESVSDAYRLLDLTPYGRQEDFEDSPDGWPQKPTYGA